MKLLVHVTRVIRETFEVEVDQNTYTAAVAAAAKAPLEGRQIDWEEVYVDRALIEVPVATVKIEPVPEPVLEAAPGTQWLRKQAMK